jgi:hypothetical protein
MIGANKKAMAAAFMVYEWKLERLLGTWIANPFYSMLTDGRLSFPRRNFVGPARRAARCSTV